MNQKTSETEHSLMDTKKYRRVQSVIVLLLVQCCLVNAQIKTIQLTDNTLDYVRFMAKNDYEPRFFAAGGKSIMLYEIDAGSRLRIFEKDNAGEYSIETSVEILATPSFLTTNGNWFAVAVPNQIMTFRTNHNSEISDVIWFDTDFSFMKLLSDDSLVLIDSSLIQTYEYVNGNWSLLHEQPVDFIVQPKFFLLSQNTDSQPHLTDTTLAAFNPSTNNVELYTRNQNKSWSLVDQIPIITEQYRANRIIWNGGDTAVIAHLSRQLSSQPVSRLLIYRKDNGEWLLDQIIDNGISTQFMGFSMLLINSNLIAIGVPAPIGGEVWYLQRTTDSSWQFSAKLSGPNDRKLFGHSLQQNDDGIVVYSEKYNNSYFRTAVLISKCYLPIELVCHNVVIDDCEDGFDVTYDQLYTITDPCATLHIDGVRGNAKSTTLALSFSSYMFGSPSCNATISCGTPGPQTSPASTSAPSNVTPLSSTTPMSSTVPIETPRSDDKVVNSAGLGYSQSLTFLVVLCSTALLFI